MAVKRMDNILIVVDSLEAMEASIAVLPKQLPT